MGFLLLSIFSLGNTNNKVRCRLLIWKSTHPSHKSLPPTNKVWSKVLQCMSFCSLGSGVVSQYAMGRYPPRETPPGRHSLPLDRHPLSLGRHPLPWTDSPQADTHPRQTPPPRQTHSPPGQTPPGQTPPLPGQTPPRQTPLLGRHPLGRHPSLVNTPSGQTPPWPDSPPPGRHPHRQTSLPPEYYGIWSTSGRYASTGMHTCYI